MIGYREAGGLLLWKPVRAGHELNSAALNLVREFFSAVDVGKPCTIWGEDDTMRIRPLESVDVEFRNPLYTAKIAAEWLKQ